VDFPGYDNAQRHGWDGQIKSNSPSAWIPSGFSGWEFGCDQDPKRKAEGDYAARTDVISAADRKQTVFIFVTPRNWPGKDAWAKGKKVRGQWKDVKAYDASDLEQCSNSQSPFKVGCRRNYPQMRKLCPLECISYSTQ
jgi:hypothetical protein